MGELFVFWDLGHPLSLPRGTPKPKWPLQHLLWHICWPRQRDGANKDPAGRSPAPTGHGPSSGGLGQGWGLRAPPGATAFVGAGVGLGGWGRAVSPPKHTPDIFMTFFFGIFTSLLIFCCYFFTILLLFSSISCFICFYAFFLIFNFFLCFLKIFLCYFLIFFFFFP